MTRIFGLDKREVESLAAAVTTADDPIDAFARSTWTCIAEPGDRMAGVLIATLGATGALQAVIDRVPAADISASLVAEGVDDSLAADVRLGIDRWLPRLESKTATLVLRQAARVGVRLLVPTSPEWPAGVNDLGAHAPTALWVRGQLPVLAALDHAIALVGARAATGYGEHVTMEASAGLVDRGFAIVSGAAYGIDGMAHRAALASRGITVAILAGGVDRFYPSGHDALLARIVEAGAVISEVPCGVPPTKWRFLQRNRLIAAASQATIVLEAGWRSGSLNTAGHAATLGRPVGAVPGPVTSAASAGCHRLIREYHATLVTTADEMAELAGAPSSSEPLEASGQHSDEARLLDALSMRSPRTAVDLARRSGLSLAAVQATLGELELDAKVREGERGWLKPTPPRANE